MDDGEIERAIGLNMLGAYRPSLDRDHRIGKGTPIGRLDTAQARI
jgi:hypothetical protein